MSGGVRILIRLQCFYCNKMLAVPFRKLRSQDSAHDYLRQHDWIFGVEKLGDGDVAFDPLCTVHGRAVVVQMLEAGVPIEADAKHRLQQIYPDLFERKTDA